MKDLCLGIRHGHGLLLALALAQLTAEPAGAQVPTVLAGDQFVANVQTFVGVREPSIATDQSGDFVVVWETRYLDPEVPDAIHARQFLSDGSPIGGEIQVSSYAAAEGKLRIPDVAVAPAGDFVVTWSSVGSPGDDESDYSVQARRFASDGSPKSDQFQVNSYTTGRQSSSHVAIHANGDFVVIWTEASDPKAGIGSAQRFSSSGDFIGSPIPTPDARSVAIAGDGGFVVAGARSDTPGDPGFTDIVGEVFHSDGSSVRGPFQISTNTSNPHRAPGLAPRPDGGFVVAWLDRPTSGLAGTGRFRRFDSGGSPVTPELDMGVETEVAEIDSDAAGDFVVPIQYYYLVRSQRISAVDETIGDPVDVEVSGSFLFESTVAVAPHGDFVMAWHLVAQEIQLQRLRVTADIGDRVWLDENANGIQDPGEPGVPDVLIRLKSGSGQLLASTRTDEEGHFLFRPKIALEGVVDKFYLKFVAPHAMAFTRQDVGLGSFEDADSDADPLSGNTAVFLIESAGEIHFDIDAGLVDDSGIFSDGFESGDMTAWSSSN